MEKDLSKITNVLIVKERFYYLTINLNIKNIMGIDMVLDYGYQIVPDEWGIYNGFEYIDNAYAYLHKIQTEINIPT